MSALRALPAAASWRPAAACFTCRRAELAQIAKQLATLEGKLKPLRASKAAHDEEIKVASAQLEAATSHMSSVRCRQHAAATPGAPPHPPCTPHSTSWARARIASECCRNRAAHRHG